MKNIALALLLVFAAGCGDDMNDIDESAHENLINSTKTAAAVIAPSSGLMTSVTMRRVVPALSGWTSQVAFHAAVGGFLHGSTEAYFEAGITARRVCQLPMTCTNTWKWFVDYAPASWATSTGIALRQGDTISATAFVDPASPSVGRATFVNETTGQSMTMTATKPATAPYFGDRGGMLVERLGNDALSNFGTQSATWTATTTSGTAGVVGLKDMFSNSGVQMVSSSAPNANTAQFQWLAAGP